jgi:multiple sugar transport system substrate-binding protein
MTRLLASPLLRTTKLLVLSAIILLVSAVLLVGCGGGGSSQGGGTAGQPVTITIWHTYKEQMQGSFEGLIDEFNETVGKEQGIIVEVSSVADQPNINDKLLMAAAGEPGAPELPDICVVYPDVATVLSKSGVLTDLETLFTPEELAAYVPAFLDEGRVDGSLRVLPVSKSTEILYLNKTIFDRFATDTGVSIENLSTFEGLAATAETYYDWSGGKSLFYLGDTFHYYYVATQQLGADLTADGQVDTGTDAYRQAESYFLASTSSGRAAIYDDYGTNLLMTGDIIVNLTTSAGCTYTPRVVTYPDNTQEQVEFVTLPFPVFEDAEKVALSRGGGMCIFDKGGGHPEAAAVFLKWLTLPENNVRFTAMTGYLPVTEEAFDTVMRDELPQGSDAIVASTIRTVTEMQDDYRFVALPAWDGAAAMEATFNAVLLDRARMEKDRYQEQMGTGRP